ncbi:MAG: Uma2 family endonuclease [Gemmatimonadaceae bacterium]
MAMPATHWTVEMVRALPDDGKRYEVIDGELFVTPSPTLQHQRAAFELGVLLRAYVGTHALGDVLLAPADVLATEHVTVQPDVLVAPLIEGRKPRSWEDIGTLLLAVEVLSPSTARADRHVKRRLYQREHVPEYWIVDADARLIERWRPEDERPEILAEQLEWRPDPAHPPLIIDLPAYFRDVTGD